MIVPLVHHALTPSGFAVLGGVVLLLVAVSVLWRKGNADSGVGETMEWTHEAPSTVGYWLRKGPAGQPRVVGVWEVPEYGPGLWMFGDNFNRGESLRPDAHYPHPQARWYGPIPRDDKWPE